MDVRFNVKGVSLSKTTQAPDGRLFYTGAVSIEVYGPQGSGLEGVTFNVGFASVPSLDAAVRQALRKLADFGMALHSGAQNALPPEA